MKSIALIDGDEVALKASAVSTTSVDWDGDGEVTSSGSMQKALKTAKTMVDSWLAGSRCSIEKVILSPRGRTNFRKRILTTYKAARGSEKPEDYWAVVDWLKSTYDAEEAPEGLEADDLIGVYATQIPTATICSSDKDFATIPARWYRPLKAGAALRKTNLAMADWAWMKQTLTGDSSDGYKGCPRIGPVNADKILAERFGSLDGMWEAVVKTFESKDLTEDDAIVQARCSRILRHGDVDLNNKTIYLWHPSVPRGIPIPMEVE